MLVDSLPEVEGHQQGVAMSTKCEPKHRGMLRWRRTVASDGC